ncbi:unnamed protein product [Acanthoscelides obtectus]|uniref:DUF7869 domain-containing protein n=1 Tax=Acanthoscelides obtectus TaxID=200917 RepID=A0A9P0JLW6_ACAOB|nr:unnamed protein product [Acanthoscelides obtectus]CAK1634739.1 hypothetical protein AOBTE_LOCUS8878 [Acanthoscelides obtectus]
MSSESESEDPFTGYDSDKDNEYFPSESDRLVVQVIQGYVSELTADIIISAMKMRILLSKLGKNLFRYLRYLQLANTSKQVPERRRKGKCEDNSKKKASFYFYFTIDSNRIQKRSIPEDAKQLRPKNDRCDVCELVKLNEMDQTQLDEQTKINYEKHMVEKKTCRQERHSDRESKEKTVLCFDLQNVLTCPKAEVSKFYYKSKLSVYNLTAHLSLTKQVYCAVWTVHLIGRTGNDIASALYKILSQVVKDHPIMTELILWYDSCVPQNRNSIISFAITRLLWEGQTNLKTVTIKYSVPGHSCVQEIDATHSAIERVLDKTEYYSPLSLIRILLKVNAHRPYKIIQMQLKDFMNFQTVCSLHRYNRVPFSKVSSLQFRKSIPHIVHYKISRSENSFKYKMKKLWKMVYKVD